MLKKRFNGKIYKKRKTNNYDVWTFYYTANKKLIKKKPVQKKKNWSLLFFAINVIVIVAILIIQLNSEEGITSLSSIFKSNAKFQYIIIALLCFFVANILSSFKCSWYYKKLENKFRPLLCFKTHMISKYYTKITPFGIGGQPFEVYYFNKNGVKATNSLTMVSCSYVSNKIVYGILALIMIITFAFNPLLTSNNVKTNLVIIFACISFTVLAIFLTFIILLCVNKKCGHKIIAWMVKLLSKLKIIKNPSALYLKIMRPTLIFQRKMKAFFKTKSVTLIFLLISLFEYIIEYSIPFFIYSAFNGLNFDMYWQLLSISLIIELACHIVPLPGGSGMAELSFYAVFASLFDAGVLFWAMILWRLISYYNYLFIGFGIIIYDYIIGNKKLKKRKLK